MVSMTNSPALKTKVLFVGGLVLALFQLVIPVYVYMIDLQLRAIHVALGISLAWLIFPFRKIVHQEKLTLRDLFIVLVMMASNLNIFLKTLSIYSIPGGATTLDFILGIALFLVLIETARRSVGLAIPIIVLALIAYVYVGPWMPGVWRIRGLSWQFLVNSIYYSPLGIYGSVTGMSATFIAMFIIFGGLLSVTGAGRTFIDLALALTGRFTGGPAKTAVISSALFGSISGSSVANVMVTGNYTIPMMKRLGYRSEFAGAVEAIASTGGGVTPPIMSITAFMMAEFLGISYLKIIGYAIIPCLLYYTGVFSGVHFQTLRRGLATLPKEEIPRWRDVLTFPKMSGFILPTGVLLFSIYSGKPLIDAGYYACLCALAVFFALHVRTLGWKKLIAETAKALGEGGLDLVRLVPILVTVSVLVNLIGVTGLAPKVSGLILEIGSNNIYLSLLIATIVPFILGTSLPVVPTYVISLSILMPALQKLGIDEIAAHLFFIYWAVLGSVTPPTCTAAVVAAGIAKADWVKTGVYAVKLGAVAFFLPYFFVLNPALVARGPWTDVLIAGVTGFFGAIAMAYGLFGWTPRRINLLLRVLFFGGGLLMLFPEHLTSVGGLGIVVATLFLDRRLRKEKASPSPSPSPDF